MQSPSILCGVPFKENLREGQRKAIELVAERNRTSLNIQLPTGYGKTLTAAAAYSVLQHQGRINRLLYIVPSTGQLDQFIQDGSNDFWKASIDGSRNVVDAAFNEARALRDHRNNSAQIFTCTIQGLTNRRSTLWQTVVELMAQGRWLVVVDEYHHYGVDAHWGKEISRLNFVFRLAMSATPYRKADDSAFGEPDLIITYRSAVEEGAVKKLDCHSYIYRVDMFDEVTGDVRSYTTQELAEEAGSDDPEAIEKLRVKRKMRWSPKYVSPLVNTPIERMLKNRVRTGLPLQVLIGAMCCSHAEMVCEQVKAMYPELRIDWVGTGDNGREQAVNKKILSRFCPAKDESGRRREEEIEIDVLIHVAMAGEGLDSIYVTEIIHLNPANINNSNHQENGRAARALEGLIGYINVDSCSPYAKFTGERIMDLMDDPWVEPAEDPELPNLQDQNNDDELPDEPKIRDLDIAILDMEWIEIDQGYPRYEKVWERHYNVDFSKMTEEDRDYHRKLVREDFYKLRKEEAEQHNARSVVAQLEQHVGNALSAVTGLVFNKMQTTAGARLDKTLRGDIKKRINTRKKIVLGGIERDHDILKTHYHWLVNLYSEIKERGIPVWMQ